MSAIEKILVRFDAVALPSGHYQIAFVTPEEFKAALAEAWDRGYEDSDDEAYQSGTHGRTDNPWRKS